MDPNFGVINPSLQHGLLPGQNFIPQHPHLGVPGAVATQEVSLNPNQQVTGHIANVVQTPVLVPPLVTGTNVVHNVPLNGQVSTGHNLIQTTTVPGQVTTITSAPVAFETTSAFIQPSYPGMDSGIPIKKISSGTMRKRTKKIGEGKWTQKDELKFRKKYFK